MSDYDLPPRLKNGLRTGCRLLNGVAIGLVIVIVGFLAWTGILGVMVSSSVKGIMASVSSSTSEAIVRKVTVRVETPQGLRIGSSVLAVKSRIEYGLEGCGGADLSVRGRGQRVLLPNGDELFVLPVSAYFASHWRDAGRVVFPCAANPMGGTWSPGGYVLRRGIAIAFVRSCDMGVYGERYGYSMRVVMVSTSEKPVIDHYPGWSNSTDESRSFRLEGRSNPIGENAIPVRREAFLPKIRTDNYIYKSDMYKEDF